MNSKGSYYFNNESYSTPVKSYKNSIPNDHSSGLTTYPITEHLSWALPGESLQKKENNLYFVTYEKRINGDIFVTNYRLYFESKNNIYKLSIPLGLFSKVEKYGHSSNTTKSDSYGLEIHLKDQRKFKLAYPTKFITKHIRRDLYNTLHKVAFPITHNLPFFSTVYKSVATYELDCWNLYNPEAEYSRFGIPNNDWVACRVNQNYTFCPSYPALFYVPKASIDNDFQFLYKVANLRSSKRIPVLSWMNCKSTAAIVRSSQPMIGFKLTTSKKVTDDERYLQMIADTNHNIKWSLSIIDARPQANAQANRAKGGGFENYENCTLEFMDIQNIHVIRDSMKKVREVCSAYATHEMLPKFIENTKWLNHLETIIRASERVVYLVNEKRHTVLVHCSDGWDRTAQITSLSMLMMDSYYRTINGFAILIEKEWCSFGHKFAHRVGHGVDKHSDQERSPIFIQFIDCVWQLYNNFKERFEFNEKYLLFIVDELYTCRFGTFLFNNERERFREHHCQDTTVSIWTHIYSNYEEFVNPSYNHSLLVSTEVKSDPLNFTDHYRKLTLWNTCYCRNSEESWVFDGSKKDEFIDSKKGSFDGSSDDNSSYSYVEAKDALCEMLQQQDISNSPYNTTSSFDKHNTTTLFEGNSTFHPHNSPIIQPTRHAPPRPTTRPSPHKNPSSNISTVMVPTGDCPLIGEERNSSQIYNISYSKLSKMEEKSDY
uniref:phosphatidylinositol-3,5-bisphosphate 3-phosphatase n=1 Tax=Parastrongyloides trichosuri TaxID=131310 RepID=A0A0N4ZNX2_PARTI